MTSSQRVILKNASSLMGSQLITWGLALLVTVFLPRHLGPNLMGQMQIATSLWAILSLLISFGMDTYLTKEIARTPDSSGALLGTSLLLRAIFFGVSCAFVAGYVATLGYSADIVQVIFIIGLSQLGWSLANGCRAALQGLEAMEYISLADVASKALYALLVIGAVLLNLGILPIALLAVISATVNLGIQLVALVKQHPLRVRPSIKAAQAMLRRSLPFLFSGAALVVYGQVDILIISHLLDEEAVGWYGTAVRLYATFLFIPSVLITAIFPSLSRAFAANSSSLIPLIRRSFDLLLIVSVPIGLGMLVLGEPVIQLLYGPAFAPSGAILSMFGLVTIFTYMNILVGKFLVATDRQNIWAVVMTIATALTIPLDIIFIRWCQEAFANGALGGTFSYLITEGGMVALGIFLLPKGSLGWSNLRSSALILIAGLLMAGLVWLCRDLPLPLPILAGVVSYLLLILFFRVVPKAELVLLKDAFGSVLSRVRRRAVSSV